MGDRLIFQLGTNNWQRGGEFAPGSGILHEAHHNAYNAIPGLRCYSMYPSRRQRFREELVRVFPLEHDIPICESISPVSSYRWHSMDDDEVAAYIQRWSMVSADRARQQLRFLTHPLWRAYITTYVEGFELLSRWLDARPSGQSGADRFLRLLDEPLTPAGIAGELRTV